MAGQQPTSRKLRMPSSLKPPCDRGPPRYERTYIVSGHAGLVHTHLRELLAGWREVPLPRGRGGGGGAARCCGLMWVEETDGVYDHATYGVRCALKNLLGEEKAVVTDKWELYRNVRAEFPEMAARHFAETWLLPDLCAELRGQQPPRKRQCRNKADDDQHVRKDSNEKSGEDEAGKEKENLREKEQAAQVYIIRPVGRGAFSGHGIRLACTLEELEEARHALSAKFTKVIASIYVQRPLLFEERKLHLRMYFPVCTESDAAPYRWFFWQRGKILTAGKLHVGEL
eukprot:TRINITY_DN403_c0_g1_i2.p1 TRINITY_DN403_c0_g1~~TRINITY_DN403_c0_g1_i2.p1  ORF type:complete len:285 (-),score=95.46 TRINITY_DN403_c0_g1_i2:459-1313(-)